MTLPEAAESIVLHAGVSRAGRFGSGQRCAFAVGRATQGYWGPADLTRDGSRPDPAAGLALRGQLDQEPA